MAISIEKSTKSKVANYYLTHTPEVIEAESRNLKIKRIYKNERAIFKNYVLYEISNLQDGNWEGV